MGSLCPDVLAVSLRILCLADVLPCADSGASGTDYLGAEALRSAGNEVETVWADELPHRISHYNLRYLLELPPAYRRIVAGRLRKGRYDVVQISQPHGYLAAKFVRQHARGAIFVHRSHGLEGRARDELRPWRQELERSPAGLRQLAQWMVAAGLERSNRRIATYAHGHLVSASECASYLTRVYGVPATAVRAIPQAVPDAYVIDVVPMSQSRIRRLLYVGQYAFFKAPTVLGRVVSTVLKERPDATFTWVCARQHHEAALSCVDAGVRGRVEMLGGMSQDELRAVYDSHGIFLFPSYFEGFGKAFLEAMSRGLVVIAADNGGMRDVIDDGVTGYKCQTGDAKAMTDIALRVSDNFQLASQVSTNAATSAANYTWQRFGLEASRFYEGLIEHTARNAPRPV